MNLGSSRSGLRAARRRLGAALGGATLVLLATLALAASPPRRLAVSPAAATVHPISEGSLEWGVKESWRDYIGSNTEVGGGAELTGWTEDSGGHPYPEGFRFPVLSGSFDDESSTTELELGGRVHLQSYCDREEPDSCLLDTEYSDLSLHIGPGSQVLRGTHTGYSREDPGGELHEDVDVVLARYDVEGATTDFSGGAARWSEIPTVAGPGLNIYGESTVIDPTSVEYAGPGGAPDLEEHWDTPGAPVLDPGEAWLADPASGARVLHASPGGDVVHAVDLVGPGTSGAELVLAALDAETLEPVGSPYVWPYPDATASDEVEFAARDSWYDPDSGTAGIHGEGEVTFRWKAHTIDLTASDPEIEIDGGDSRAIFRVSGSEGTLYPDQRADLVDLDVSGEPSVSGDTYAYDLMRGVLTENGVNVFAGFYSPPDDDEFGCVSVGFEVP